MFEKERAEIRVLSNIADAQGLIVARDLLRKAESEFAEADRKRQADTYLSNHAAFTSGYL
jgi:hypothetical protein